ncbi:MAG: lysophospholipid acyltransferase family protein [Ferruginibacter sp.]
MYYIIYGLLYLVSLLPFFILYGLSNFAYFIIYHILGYRKKVVFNNLDIAFPEKSAIEKKQIARKFYKNLTDNFIETIKLLSMSEKEFSKRAETVNLDAVNLLASKGKNIQLHSGHQMNWEYAHLVIAKNIHLRLVTVYMRITNKALDRLFLKIRSHGNALMVAAQDFKSQGHEIFKNQYSLGLVGDQNPGAPQSSFWLNFFNKPAPFVTGPDKSAVINNTAVVFVKMVKLKRGYYNFHCSIITEEASSFKKGELTLLYRDFLEAAIREQPDNYLWSHRRWKFEWEPKYEKKWIDKVDAPLNKA